MTEQLQVFDTLKKELTEITPTNNIIRIYCCGITSYDVCHIGHGRVSIVMDIVVRFLQWKKYQVHYVSNITDFEDKVIARAKELNISWSELSEDVIASYKEDMHSLNVLKPWRQPKASAYINEMVDMIKKLVDLKHAYIHNNDVYFDVSSHPGYGCLSKQNLDLTKVSRDIKSNKTHQNDFILWKSVSSDAVGYDSCFGWGRPGWHIECSAMSSKLLGESIDIHAGGLDLLFPHHENELAQSWCCHASMPVKAWMHIGLVNVGLKKMSKSYGNFKTISEVVKSHGHNAIRMMCISHKYNHSINFEESKIIASSKAYRKILRAVSVDVASESTLPNEQYISKFESYMLQDFNFTKVCALLFVLAKEIHSIHDQERDGKVMALRKIMTVLGFTL